MSLDKFYFIIQDGKSKKVSKEEFENFHKGEKPAYLCLLKNKEKENGKVFNVEWWQG